ncbi:MAG: hypothetical protein Q4G33_13480 [bacterium]|nr:hypothetical protein [bacterium]
MKKFKKIIALGLAAMTAVSAMSISAMAAETNSVTVKDNEIFLGNEDFEYLGKMLVIYENGELSKMIPVENDNDELSVMIEADEAQIYTADGNLDETIDISDAISDVSNVRATILHTYRIKTNDVNLRSAMSTSSSVVAVLQKGMIFGCPFGGNGSVWLHGEVVDDLDYYSYSIDGWGGYVYAMYASYIN